MPGQKPHHVNRDSAAASTPPRRRGGQELPDDVQDRPEQNAGYDAAVRSGPAADSQRELDLETLPGDDGPRLTIEDIADVDEPSPIDADERAERDVIAEIRRRERASR